MTYPDVLTALARERVTAFLGKAQVGRQASLARAARPLERGKRVVLRDGSKVLTGPVRNGDAPLLADGFAPAEPSVPLDAVPGYQDLTASQAARLGQMPQPGSQPC
jgi:hypothetical protein